MKNEVMKQNSATDSRTFSLRTVWRVIEKTFYTLLLVMCAALVILTAWLAIDKFVLKSKVPSVAGYSVLVVGSGSMESTIMEGDLILIKDTGDYKIGDIVTFFQEGDTVPTTHRIVMYDESGDEMAYVTRGDFTGEKDRQSVAKSNVVGEVVATWHTLGLLFGWITKGGGAVFVIAVLVILALGIFLIKDENSRQLYLKQQEQAEEPAEAPAEETAVASDSDVQAP